MANTSRIQGIRPIDQPYGSVRVNYYKAQTGQAMYKNMPLVQNNSGYVAEATPGVLNDLCGVAVGYLDGEWGPIDNAQGYVATNPSNVDTNGLINVLVADDPSQYFLIEEDTGGSALTVSAINNACSWIYTATTANTSSGYSNAVLDRSTVGTGTDLNLKLIKLWDKPDNAYGDWAKWVVKIIRHQNGQQTSGTTILT